MASRELAAGPPAQPQLGLHFITFNLATMPSNPPTTPPQSTGAVLQTTPVHLRTSTTSRFEAKYIPCDDLFATMVAEMSPYFLGPMPCADFFKTFLPVPESSAPGDASGPNRFSPGFFSSLEAPKVNIYSQFVSFCFYLVQITKKSLG